jgi:hypothetical protein
MSKLRDGIDEELAAWIEQQHVFFVATSPLAADGHVNCSPKGGDCFRILGPNAVAYLDYTGSGAETAAHLNENGRIVVMFCAFAGKPHIVRLHGIGQVLTSDSPGYRSLIGVFPNNPGARSIVRIELDRVSTSCGYSIPFMEYLEERETLDKWSANKGPEALVKYREEKNAVSIDGLPAFAADRRQ